MLSRVLSFPKNLVACVKLILGKYRTDKMIGKAVTETRENDCKLLWTKLRKVADCFVSIDKGHQGLRPFTKTKKKCETNLNIQFQQLLTGKPFSDVFTVKRSTFHSRLSCDCLSEKLQTIHTCFRSAIFVAVTGPSILSCACAAPMK